MAEANGYITVFEASDGGTGNPRDTRWQFFVCTATDRQAVNTRNEWLAETVRLAIANSAFVRVTYDPKSLVASQVRMTFDYACESHELEPCEPNSPGPKRICETRKYTACAPGKIPPPEDAKRRKK